MSDENEKKPDPIEDVRKGLGLLFRAAKTAVNELPTDKLESAVVSGVKEVGKAIENVAQAIDKEVFKKAPPPKAAAADKQVRVEDEKTAEPQPPKDDAPKT